MRESQFPFPKYRDYGQTPIEYPDVDDNAIMRLSTWQHRLGKKGVIYDDITGYWQFGAHPKDVQKYTQSPMHKAFGLEDTEDVEIEGKKLRMPVHIAESAEVAISSFLAVAKMRKVVLEEGLKQASNEDLTDLDVSSELASFICEAITDYGYCLEYPVVTGWISEEQSRAEVDEENWLRDKIQSFSPHIGRQLLDFGLYTLEDKSKIISADGITVMDAALGEQERRTQVWGGRYNALTEVYPDIERSADALGVLTLSEVFDIQAELPRVA